MTGEYAGKLEELNRRIQLALGLADNTDGAHHKQHTIDQMVRALTGEDYEAWVKEHKHCGETTCDFHNGFPDAEYCEYGYRWDEGIPA